MIKHFITIILLASSIFSYGQTPQNSKWDNVTIYEYGTPLSTCENNFENLFRNWSKWITNYQQTEFVSYEYVTKLNDTTQIANYAKKMIRWESLMPKVRRTNREKVNADSSKISRELYFNTESLDNVFKMMKVDNTMKSKFRSEWESNLILMRTQFRNTVHIGDKVYSIKLKITGQTYDHYVICRPGDNRIVYDQLFLGISEVRDVLIKLKY